MTAKQIESSSQKLEKDIKYGWSGWSEWYGWKSAAYLTQSSEGEASCEGDDAALSEQTASNDDENHNNNIILFS